MRTCGSSVTRCGTRPKERLADYKGRAGRRPSGGKRKTAPRTLNGLVYCKQHDEPLRTWGHNGDDMACSSCKRGG